MTLFRRLKNSEWVRQSFMISHNVGLDTTPDDDEVKLRARYFTTAKYKFTDTTLGGNMVINPLPQFTRSADLRVKSLSRSSRGLGRAYSEYIDDNKRLVTMVFGVPQFNSLTSFFQHFYDSQASSLARTGRTGGPLYLIGRAAGLIVAVKYWPILLFSVSNALYKWALQKPTSKFYYLKPTMPVYWSAVANIVNDLAVGRNLVARAIGQDYPTPNERGDVLNTGEMIEINKMMSDLIDSFDPASGDGNGINMYAVATKHQRMARSAYSALRDIYKNGEPPDDLNTVVEQIEQAISNSVSEVRAPKVGFADYINKWLSSGGSATSSTSTEPNPTTNDKSDFNGDLLNEKILDPKDPKNQGLLDTFTEFLEAELDDGAQFVTFRVENQGSVSESFNNQVGESELAGKINSISGSARSMRNSFAQGNIDDGIIGSTVGAIMGGVKDVVSGVADSVGLGGLAILGGNAFVDIPQNWQSSTAKMPSMSYTMKLRSPYGNNYNNFVNIYIPLAMILAGSLPLSTGRHTYTSPFICQLFDRGRAQTRLGIIDSISITRGTTNVPFNAVGNPLGIDVTFSVTDLSTVVHMPISSGFSLTDILGIFDDETTYTDYINVLSSLSLWEQIYAGERFKLAVTRLMKRKDTTFSLANVTNYLGDLGLLRFATIAYDGVVNR